MEKMTVLKNEFGRVLCALEASPAIKNKSKASLSFDFYKFCFPLLSLLLLLVAIYPASTMAETASEIAVKNKEAKINALWSTKAWLGMQLLPDYSDGGENRGLKTTKPYLAIKSVSRWYDKIDGETDDTSKPGDERTFGVDVVMMGAGVVKDDGITVEQPSSFNDVSKTLDVSVYANWAMGNDWFIYWPGSSLAIELPRFGFISRDQKDADGNMVNKYGRVGFVYRYFDIDEFHNMSLPSSNERTVYPRYSQSDLTPRIEAQFMYGWYEDYALRHNANRFIMDLDVQITESLPWHLAFNMNSGAGPDDYSVRLAVVQPLTKLGELLGISTDKSGSGSNATPAKTPPAGMGEAKSP